MVLPARLRAELLPHFTEIAYSLYQRPQDQDYVDWLANRVCSNIAGLYEWAEVKDALQAVIPLTEKVHAFLERGLLPSSTTTFEEALAEAADRVLSISVSGGTEFAHGRRAGLRAAAVRLRDWHRDSLADKPSVEPQPATAALTRPAHHVIAPDPDPLTKVDQLLVAALGEYGTATPVQVAWIMVSLPPAAQMLADRDRLRRQLRRLWELEQTIRLDWNPTPERLRDRAELAAEIDQLARTMAPTGAHGSSYGQGFAAGFGRAQSVLLEIADDVRGVWLPGLTAEDVDFSDQ
ncbi:hypothetical protein [Kribbella sp. DT2]|uniref:hypothetical protein n=1 Tax=Kribbella sp. DT2 TaxID=3393427 RepID=UPI003CEC3E54